MRIVHVNKYFFPPHLGGVEQSLNLLTTSLAAAGHEVRAIVANEGSDTVGETIGGVQVLRLGRSAAFASTPIALGMSRAILSATTGERPADVLHFHFPYPWGDAAWLAAGAKGPAVMTYHADIVRQKNILKAYAPLLRRVLARVDRIIVGAPQIAENSPFVSPHLDKVRVVPFAIDPARFADEAAISSRAAEIIATLRGPTVLFVGRLVYYKGVEVLVRAMDAVRGDLVIIGTGPLEGRLREIATALGITDRIRFIERVDDVDLAAWYRAADVFCLPSTEPSEAYGLVQLEAHLSGTPVVSTDLPTGVPFVNADGVTGIVVPVGDSVRLGEALNRLLDDLDLRERFGTQALRRANTDFTLDGMVAKTLMVYDEAISSHAERGGP
ncbi:MAG: glycosyltransferase [Coriobacteriia bacterium]|nr:glycosyltransferase [Coriobacteriia bacterium]